MSFPCCGLHCSLVLPYCKAVFIDIFFNLDHSVCLSIPEMAILDHLIFMSQLVLNGYEVHVTGEKL